MQICTHVLYVSPTVSSRTCKKTPPSQIDETRKCVRSICSRKTTNPNKFSEKVVVFPEDRLNPKQLFRPLPPVVANLSST